MNKINVNDKVGLEQFFENSDGSGFTDGPG